MQAILTISHAGAFEMELALAYDVSTDEQLKTVLMGICENEQKVDEAVANRTDFKAFEAFLDWLQQWYETERDEYPEPQLSAQIAMFTLDEGVPDMDDIGF